MKYLFLFSLKNNKINFKMLCARNLLSVLRIDCCSNNDNSCPFVYKSLQPLYNMVHYNTILDITRFNDGSQKCIDYIEK